MKFKASYPLKPFQSIDQNKIKAVIEKFPLATLVSENDDWPMVTQVPLIYIPSKGHNTLYGHFDFNNPHGDLISQSEKIYCLFSTPNHYVSPSIYPDKHYPGWVYVSVHVTGFVSVIDEYETKRDILIELSKQNEPTNSGYELRAEQENFDVYIKMIQMFKIDIEDSKAIVKLAQDKGPDHSILAAVHLAEKSKEDLTTFFKELL